MKKLLSSVLFLQLSGLAQSINEVPSHADIGQLLSKQQPYIYQAAYPSVGFDYSNEDVKSFTTFVSAGVFTNGVYSKVDFSVKVKEVVNAHEDAFMGVQTPRTHNNSNVKTEENIFFCNLFLEASIESSVTVGGSFSFAKFFSIGAEGKWNKGISTGTSFSSEKIPRPKLLKTVINGQTFLDKTSTHDLETICKKYFIPYYKDTIKQKLFEKMKERLFYSSNRLCGDPTNSYDNMDSECLALGSRFRCRKMLSPMVPSYKKGICLKVGFQGDLCSPFEEKEELLRRGVKIKPCDRNLKCYGGRWVSNSVLNSDGMERSTSGMHYEYGTCRLPRYGEKADPDVIN
jgi:hypothetical protein